MTSRRYQKTLNRQQDMLLPLRVEEFVSENNNVRAIDAYVNTAYVGLRNETQHFVWFVYLLGFVPQLVRWVFSRSQALAWKCLLSSSA